MAKGEAGRNSIEWAKCIGDFAYFCDAYVIIDEPQGDGFAEVPFRLWPRQIDLAWQLMHTRLMIILKARQLGISWLACAYALWLCLTNNGRVVLLFSRGQLEADEMLRRVGAMYGRLPVWMRSAVALCGNNKSVLEYENGSRIQSLPATENAGRSFTASLVVMDEAAFMAYADKLYTALKPTIDNGGQLFIVSTANGEQGFFHKLWGAAVKKLNSFATVFLNWRANPNRDDEWRGRVASEAVTSALDLQEYPETPEDAFSATSNEKFLASMIWWDNLRAVIPPLDKRTPIILAADAGISNDSFALVGVSRHWQHEDDAVAVRYAREWIPPKRGQIDFSKVEDEIRRLCKEYNVIELTYDPYQLHDMATRLRNEGVVMTRAFTQGVDRLEADKQLLDVIMQKRLAHDGDEALRRHIDNADRKPDTDLKKLRIVKREDSLKIDMAVSASMAVYRCLKLPL